MKTSHLLLFGATGLFTLLNASAPVVQGAEPLIAEEGCCRNGTSNPTAFWGRRGVMDSVCIDPTGRWIGVAGRSAGTAGCNDRGDLVIYEARTGAEAAAVVFLNRARRLYFDSTGTRLAVITSPDPTVVGDLAERIFFFVLAPDGSLNAVARGVSKSGFKRFCEFGTDCFIASDGTNLFVWSTVDWKAHTLALPACSELALSVERPLIAVARRNDTIEILDIRADRPPVKVVSGVPPLVFVGNDLAYTTEKGVLINAGLSGTEARLPERGVFATRLAASRDGRSLAIINEGGLVKVWRRVDEHTWKSGSDIVLKAVEQIRFLEHEEGVVLGSPWAEPRVVLLRDGTSIAADRDAPEISLFLGLPLQKRCSVPAGNLDRFDYSSGLLVAYAPGTEALGVWDLSKCSCTDGIWVEQWRQHPFSPFE